MCIKELREKAFGDIPRWFYDAEITFHAATLESFAIMCELIGQFGLGLKPPSMHDLRVSFLKKEVEATEKAIGEHKKEWARKDCSILSDDWHDTVVQKDIVNFLVNSLKGSVFIRSIDVSKVIKDANSVV